MHPVCRLHRVWPMNIFHSTHLCNIMSYIFHWLDNISVIWAPVSSWSTHTRAHTHTRKHEEGPFKRALLQAPLQADQRWVPPYNSGMSDFPMPSLGSLLEPHVGVRFNALPYLSKNTWTPGDVRENVHWGSIWGKNFLFLNEWCCVCLLGNSVWSETDRL